MNKTLSTFVIAAAAACFTAAFPLISQADSLDESLEFDRGADPDALAAQTWQAATEAANRRLADRLARCDKLQPGERAECRRNAQDLHDSDVARAADVLHRPQ